MYHCLNNSVYTIQSAIVKKSLVVVFTRVIGECSIFFCRLLSFPSSFLPRRLGLVGSSLRSIRSTFDNKLTKPSQLVNPSETDKPVVPLASTRLSSSEWHFVKRRRCEEMFSYEPVTLESISSTDWQKCPMFTSRQRCC